MRNVSVSTPARFLLAALIVVSGAMVQAAPAPFARPSRAAENPAAVEYLTRELADREIYLKKLEPDGQGAYHVSYLDLRGVWGCPGGVGDFEKRRHSRRYATTNCSEALIALLKELDLEE